MPGPGYYLRQGSLSILLQLLATRGNLESSQLNSMWRQPAEGTFHFKTKSDGGEKKSQTCRKTFILPDYMTQIGRAVDDNNNNEDVIKVKYLMLTRLKAECSNLIIMAGCSALNQQLLWENAPILTRKHQKKAKAGNQCRAEGQGSHLNIACVRIRALHFPTTAMCKNNNPATHSKPKHSSQTAIFKNHFT